jgi:hypothetical protein
MFLGFPEEVEIVVVLFFKTSTVSPHGIPPAVETNLSRGSIIAVSVKAQQNPVCLSSPLPATPLNVGSRGCGYITLSQAPSFFPDTYSRKAFY